MNIWSINYIENVTFNYKILPFVINRTSDSRLPYPDPLEFSQYLLYQAKTIGAGKLDEHFKPQWLSCSWCQVEFDLIGKLETLNHDRHMLLRALNRRVSV